MPAPLAPWFSLPDVETTSRQITVIGAGLAGVSTACHLRMLGWDVTLIDKHSRSAEATSGNPAGLVKPQLNSNNPPVIDYFRHYFQYFNEYFRKLSKSHSNIPSGLIDSPLSPPPSSSSKTSAWLSPKDFCRAQLAAQTGIKTLYNTDVTSLKNDSERWQCIDFEGNVLSDTTFCVLAGGFEINFLLPNNKLSIDPLAGQITLLSQSAITPTVVHACYNKHYLIPLKDNNYLCGASHHQTASLEVNQADHDENLAGLQKLLPDHVIDKSKIIANRTGIRAVSPDHLPIIGGVYEEAHYRSEYDDLHHGKKPGIYASAKYKKGLFVIGALGSHGIGNSPYLGKLLADLINGSVADEEQHILQLLHPARFLIRDLKRKPVDRKHTPQ